MNSRFEKLLKRCGAKGNVQAHYDFLEKQYLEPFRYYHNLGHISHCLVEFDSYFKFGKPVNEIEFALWYHDIVYNQKALDNEEQSSKIALNVCNNSGLTNLFCKAVEELIVCTKHTKEPANLFQQIIMDIDLAILGSDVLTYNNYENNIRKEYSFVKDNDFRLGRTDILYRFLNRSRIYYTDYFYNKYEITARNNLMRVIRTFDNDSANYEKKAAL